MPNFVIPGGESIGLQLDTGIYIIGKYDVATTNGPVSPWASSDIEPGDLLIALDQKNVHKNNDVLDIIKTKENNTTLRIKLRRKQQSILTTIKVIKNDAGNNSIGLYVKDKIQGIGTLTFVDSKTNQFGALGHAIVDENVNLANSTGTISGSHVNQIVKAIPGTPGEKQAVLKSNLLGVIYKNSSIGVFGKVTSRNSFRNPPIKVAKTTEVKLGKAELWTVINDEKIEKFAIEIIELQPQTQANIKGIKLKVIDERLLTSTGGIIQGMSGSPIIQDNQLVGAVSHVLVDKPSIGYGVYVEWMLQHGL